MTKKTNKKLSKNILQNLITKGKLKEILSLKNEIEEKYVQSSIDDFRRFAEKTGHPNVKKALEKFVSKKSSAVVTQPMFDENKECLVYPLEGLQDLEDLNEMELNEIRSSGDPSPINEMIHVGTKSSKLLVILIVLIIVVVTAVIFTFLGGISVIVIIYGSNEKTQNNTANS